MRKLVLILLLASPCFGATKVFMHNFGAPVSGYLHASTTQGALLASGVTTTTASGTSIQATQLAGGTALVWASAPLSSGVTINSTETFNIWGKESAASVNATGQVQIFKLSGGVLSAPLCTATIGTEWGTTIGVKTATCAFTSTVFSIGDRLVFKVFMTNVGTMGSGTATIDFDGKTGAADGDTFVSFVEALSFSAEPELIQAVVANASGTNTWNVTVGSTGAGHLLVAMVAGQSNTNSLSTVTDNRAGGSNAYTVVPSFHATVNKATPCASTTGFVDMAYVPNSLSGATTVTFTMTSSGADAEGWFLEWANMPTASPLDLAAFGHVNDQVATGSLNQPGPSVSPAYSELLVAADYLTSQVQNALNPWAIGPPIANGNGVAYTTGPAGTYQPTFVSNATGDCYAQGVGGFWITTPITLVQTANNFAASATVAVTFGSSTTTNNFLVVTATDQSTNSFVVSGITGGGVTTWHKAVNSNTNRDIEIWYGLVTSGSATAVSVTFTGVSSFTEATANEYNTSLSGTWTLDSTATASASSGTIASGNLTTAHTLELTVAAAASLSNNITAGPTNGYANIATANSADNMAAWQIGAVTGTYSTSWSFTSGGADGAIAGFYLAPASGFVANQSVIVVQ